jgi:hypothetical protein
MAAAAFGTCFDYARMMISGMACVIQLLVIMLLKQQ